MPVASFLVHTLAIRLALSAPISCLGTLIATSSSSVLGLAPTHLTFSVLGTFKRVLSDKLLRFRLTSLAEPLGFFPTLGPLSEKNKRKQHFDMAFINFCLLAGNHVVKEVDLSFGECECLVPVKFNRLWQLELLDRKPVCMMEVIFFAAALFWDPLFVSCLCYTIKLASKLELKTQNIVSGVVKERIKSV